MYFLPQVGLIDSLSTIPSSCVVSFIGDAYAQINHLLCRHRDGLYCSPHPRPLLLETVMMTQTEIQFFMQTLVIQLRWKHALTDCQVEGRDYTEIHFWRNPETEELVLTYWEINP